MEKVFSDWYSSKKKDLQAFKVNHIVKESNTPDNLANAKAMHHFCDAMKIIGTPTIFINGYQIPDQYYNVSDLKYFVDN